MLGSACPKPIVLGGEAVKFFHLGKKSYSYVDPVYLSSRRDLVRAVSEEECEEHSMHTRRGAAHGFQAVTAMSFLSSSNRRKRGQAIDASQLGVRDEHE